MQFKLAAFSTLAVAVLAVATPTSLKRSDAPHDQCNTGAVQCCQSVQTANSHQAKGLLGLFNVGLGDVTGMVGITCSPLTAVGIGGNSCSAQPVCCTNNSFNGIVAVGCTPININL